MTEPTPTPAGRGGQPDPPGQDPADPTPAPVAGGAPDAPPTPGSEDAGQLPEPGGREPASGSGAEDAGQLPGPGGRGASPGSGAEDPAHPREPGERGPTAGSGAEAFDGDPTAWPPDEAFDAADLDDRGWTRRDLEAILLVADEPVPAAVLAEIVGSRLSEVEELLVELAGEYARDGRGFVLRMIAGGWRLYTHPGTRNAVEAFLRAGQQSRLTRAALETLAVIAYRQPVTRFQVAAVRGVNVDGVFRTLASRGLIHEVGTDPGPGQATLYGTTPAFLEQLGLNDLDQLPPIKDYLPEGVDLLDLQEQP
jgi:segregation and condensation protein B